MAEASSQVVGNIGDMMASINRGGGGPPGNYLVRMFGTQYEQGALVPDGRDPAPEDHYDPAGRPGTRVPHTSSTTRSPAWTWPDRTWRY